MMKGEKMQKQMELFEEGGLKDEGNTKDPVSGNDVPPGATQEEVRDDIPAQLSEGEFVFPADVVRYIGLEKLMMMRQEAKMGLKMMEEMGQMGNADEATIPDDVPFSVIDIQIEKDEDEKDDKVEERAEGGVIEAANGFAGTTTATNPLQQRQPNVAGTQTGLKTAYKAPEIKPVVPAPVEGFKYKSPIDTTKKFTYEGALGKDLAGPDEYRTYVNDAGAQIEVPFRNGVKLEGFEIPEGYRLKTEEVQPTKVGTTKIKSAQQLDQGDQDAIDAEYSALGGARTTIGDVEYAVQYNLDGTVGLANVNNYRQTGQVYFNKATPEITDLVKTQAYGHVGRLAYGFKPQTAVAVQLAKELDIKVPGRDFVQEAINEGDKASKKLKNINTKKTEIFDVGQFRTQEERRQDVKEIMKQQDIQAGKDPDRSDDSFDPDAPATMSDFGSFKEQAEPDFEPVAKGGLLKKKKTKPKKMKRGGLASR